MKTELRVPRTLRSSAVKWAAVGLYRSGLMGPVSIAAGYARRQPAFQILTYHRVNDEHDPFFSATPTEVFERQIAFVARHYCVLTVEELAERMRRATLPRNALAITFDDGYRDNLTHAAPILTRYGLTATVFLATGFIGTAEVPWFDRAAMAFKTTRVQSFRTPWEGTLSLAGPGERIRALEATLRWLKRLPGHDLRRRLDTILDTLGVAGQNCFKNLMLSWDDVHALAGLGFAIGAHPVNHPILSRVSSNRAGTEILGSRTMIESACGRSPHAFAYPNGQPEDYSDTVAGLVREAGFTCAVTSRWGLNTAAVSPYELRPGGPWEHDLPIFALKLAGYRVVSPRQMRRTEDRSMLHQSDSSGRRRARIFPSIVVASLLLLLMAPPAMAYIDPGSGQLLFQILTATVLGALFYLVKFKNAVRDRVALYARRLWTALRRDQPQ